MTSYFTLTKQTTIPSTAVVSAALKGPTTEPFVLVLDEQETKATEKRSSNLLARSFNSGSFSMPGLVPTIKMKHRFRYYCSIAAAGGSITPTWRNLFRALSLQTASTTAFPLISSLKINCVTIYYNNVASTNAAPQLRFSWLTDSVGNPATTILPKSSGSIGAKMVNKAPKASLISDWHTSGDDLIVDTDPVFNVANDATSATSAASTCVIDIDMEFTLADGFHLADASFTTATNTVSLMTSEDLTVVGSSTAQSMGYQSST